MVVRQRAIPLEFRITRIASAPLPQPIELRITEVSLAGTTVAKTPVVDAFATGQFITMRDDERITAPSFEMMPSGVRIGDGLVKAGQVAQVPFDPLVVIDDPLAPPASPPSPPLPFEILQVMRAHMHGARLVATQGVRVRPIRYALATFDLAAASGETVSYAALRTQARAHGLQIVEAHEIVTS